MNVTRRKFVQAGTVMVPTALAGCSSVSAQTTVTEPSEHIDVTEVDIYRDLFTEKAQLHLRVSGLEGVDALVWIGADGQQVGAEDYEYGDTELRIFSPIDSYSQVLGTNRVVAVRGGTTDCFGEACSHSGGESVHTLEFEIGSDK